MLIALVLWLVFSTVVGLVAASFDRSGCGFLVLSLVVSPALAAIVLVIIGKKDQGSEVDSQTKECPDCAEQVKLKAQVCKHCGYEWTEDEVNESVSKVTEIEEADFLYCEREEIPVSPDGNVCTACGNSVHDGRHSPEKGG